MSFAIREHVRVSADRSVLVRHAALPPGAAVEVIVMLEPAPVSVNHAGSNAASYSFLDRAQQLSIDAPADFSTSYDDLIAPRP